MRLNEDIFKTSEDALGITNLIINSINKKWESVSDFNGVIATLNDLGYEEMAPVIEEIISNETNDIGKLQHIVETLSPAMGQDIEEGQLESEDILADEENIVESLNESMPYQFNDAKEIIKHLQDAQLIKSDEQTFNMAMDILMDKPWLVESKKLTESFDKDIYQWLDRNYGTTDWKEKFKAYVTKIEQSAYNTTTLKKDLGVAIKKFSKEVKVKPQVFQSALNEALRNKDNIERNKSLVKGEEVVESLNEDVDESAPTFYVSYYEEYPEYHPEEGGYYNAGCELVSTEEFSSLDEAKARIKELGEEDLMERISDEFYLDRSKYIGQDRFYIIETEQGSEEHTPEAYE